ncbi:hypothetical protein AVEN_246084-1 [Araneus ventricosus]|uniref:Uncharacterized protein n=1 Tax=Araneus ventricosus TaxID=182803 RepID=A0A4Y2MNM5_ARAVE|nr:hypothetical protein AVEN_246084-1 [Araneus ventricosus]
MENIRPNYPLLKISEGSASLNRAINEPDNDLLSSFTFIDEVNDFKVPILRDTGTTIDIICENRIRPEMLTASLRGPAAEIPQGIIAGKLTQTTTIKKALESRFGDGHLTQFYRNELKTRPQKPGESFQILAADVERLMSLAYGRMRSGCPGKLSSPILHRSYQRRWYATFHDIDEHKGSEIKYNIA